MHNQLPQVSACQEQHKTKKKKKKTLPKKPAKITLSAKQKRGDC